MPRQYFATVARGLESLAAEELAELGAESVEPGFCGVAFQGDRKLLYHVNLWARLPFRILLRLDTFPCQDAEDLYQGIQTLPWQEYLTPDYTLAVDATGKTPQLNHSHFTALQVKNAIVDQQRQQFGARSHIDTQTPDVRINVHLHQDGCVVSLDSSGSSLHRRGYRLAVGAAPLKESLAAALIRLSGWQSDLAFMDPLCGSGTLPLEACLQGLQIAPGVFRQQFGFQTWPDFDESLWHSLQAEAREQQLSRLPMPIWGSDQDAEVIEQAHLNAQNCNVVDHIWFESIDLQNVEPPTDSGILICNPPYGERLGDPRELGDFYRQLGQIFKQRFKGWTAFILSGNKALSQSIGLKSCQRTAVNNGSIPCQFLKYELY
ncbi:RNA methyltransferase [Acaryochloris sp. 'Moss Beach']|uniref:THUMP domain-containing class I SAM-dependent RNA methyltransferase n=1 Tax=Acaryochloris sp. 'Moss Beach' TaxID=2740837 RepID=UPI001F1F1CE6|nr:THUMP domain-containing protein [Acaryochloris sp. 'Moss Beach']UJB67868.1 RNA methyltransferase [Acaryochloris sp. 'Moss Beach']